MGNTNNKIGKIHFNLYNKSYLNNEKQSNYLNNTTSPQIPPDLADLKDACFKEEVNKIMMIIKQRSDLINDVVNHIGDTTLMISCWWGWDNIVKYLVSSHSNTININQQNKFDSTALMKAVYNGKINCVRLLLSHPLIDVNIQCGEFNKTALWYCRNRDCYDLLLPHYPTMKDYEKKMAWLYSMYSRWIGGVKEVKEVMQELSHDMLYEMRDDMGMWLWLAVDRGDEEMIRYLISSYSDVINVNIQDKFYGHTSLHRAVLSNHLIVVSILLNHPNIDVTIKNKEGKKAYEIGKQDPSPNKTKMKVMSLLPRQKLVRWNRSKIMLMGQGRAGKTALANNLAGRWMGETASTLGAEQMDMRLLYGGVKGGRLEEYERPKQELEALLAELSYYDDWRGEDSSSSLPLQTMAFYQDVKETSPKSAHIRASSLKDTLKSEEEGSVDVSLQTNGGLSRRNRITPRNVKKEEREMEDDAVTSFIMLHDIKFDEVDLHYRKLQEVDTASSYKLLLVDFGGQSIFNVLREFFMSRYGVYVVVFDMELFQSGDAAGRESCRKELKFWLNSITMHTCDTIIAGTDKTAPIAIVGTRGDKVCIEEDHEKISSELEDMFGEMKVWGSLKWYERGGGKGRLCFFPNNNKMTKANEVSQELLRTIEQSLEGADYMKREIPMSWIKMLDEMKGLDRSYLLYEEVLRMAQKKYQESEKKIQRKEKVLQTPIIDMEVREMLRFLNDMGMLMWIEEKSLEEIIILDPIEYLVRPATTIICKHVATKDDPYRTKHEVAEIHGLSKKEYGEDWLRMLEYGVVSEVLARDLLKRYYVYQRKLMKASNNTNERDEVIMIDKVVLLMMKYGLMVQSSSMYFIPSLLPPDPSMIFVEKNCTIPQYVLSRLSARQAILSSSLSKSLKFSLFFHLSTSMSFAHDVVSCLSGMELQRKGFLPSGLFERLVGPFTQSLIEKRDDGDGLSESLDKLFRDNKLIIGFQDKIQVVYKHHVVRLRNILDENRIEVEMELHDEEDMREEEKEEEREMMSRIYENVIEMIERVLRECYSSLQVMTLIPLPDNRKQPAVIVADVVSVREVREAVKEMQGFIASAKVEEKEKREVKGEGDGFVALTRVRWLLGIADHSAEERETHHLMSEDGKCWTSVKARAMKKDAYWSVWKEKVKIPILPAISSSSSCSHAPTLTGGKKTHVFLSYDWGIDGNNHHRVKQVSEALKSRGLVTWIDEERLVNEIDEKIIDGIDSTECMLVFVTENYVRKVNGGNDSDYCKREFKYGCSRLGVDRFIVVVLDKAMKDTIRWNGLIGFNLGSVIYYDLSTIFEASSCESGKSVNELMDGLYEKIFITLTGHKPLKQLSNPPLSSVFSDSSSSTTTIRAIGVKDEKTYAPRRKNKITDFFLPSFPNSSGEQKKFNK